MSPPGLHEWVARYNWDDGLAPIWVIADAPTTEFATALLIYWRLGGPWLGPGGTGINAEAKQLQDAVRDRLLAGVYPRGPSVFDPKAELSETQLFQLRKAGMPDVLLGRSPGEPD